MAQQIPSIRSDSGCCGWSPTWPPDVEVLSHAVNVASARLDLPLAERLARAAYDAQPSPATTLQLAFILYLQEKGQAAETLLDTLDTHELAAPGFVDGVNLRAANLLLPLRSPERARAVIDDALQLGDADRNHGLYVLRAVGESMAAQPAETVETMSAVDYDGLDSYGRLLGCAASTIALGDLGRVEEAGERAATGYRVLVESPQASFPDPGLAEFHAYALLAAGHVEEADSVTEHWYRRYADWPGISRSMITAAHGMTALAAR